jgi:hypothetical protein
MKELHCYNYRGFHILKPIEHCAVISPREEAPLVFLIFTYLVSAKSYHNRRGLEA